MAFHRAVKVDGVVSLLNDSTTKRTSAYVSCEGGSVRWRADGSDPTAAVGIPLYAGERMSFDDAEELPYIRFTRIDQSDEATETWLQIHLKP